jgi:hypothetical protein
VGALPAAKLRALVEQARQYSFDFLGMETRVRAAQALARATPRARVPRWGRKLTRAYLGERDRRSFFCEHCQKLHRAPVRRRKQKDACAQASPGSSRNNAARAPPARHAADCGQQAAGQKAHAIVEGTHSGSHRPRARVIKPRMPTPGSLFAGILFGAVGAGAFFLRQAPG